MTKKLIKDIVRLLKAIREDAEMALDGSWDCTTEEGMDGFQCQIDNINEMLTKIKKDDTRGK